MEQPKLELIAEDVRGASWSIKLPDNTELVLIFTKAGMLRGGHYHDKDEVSLLLSGRIHYWKEVGGLLETEFDESAGQVLHNDAGEPHLALFKKDSWLIDYKLDTKIGECTTTNVPEYRAKVDAQMKQLSS